MSTIRKFGPLFNVLKVLWAVFGMVFRLSARSRRGFRAGLAKWATVWALVFGVGAAAERLIHASVREQGGNRLPLLVAEFGAIS